MISKINLFFQTPGYKKFIPGIVWFTILLILIILPSKSLPKPDSWMITISYDKIIHLVLFGVLAFLFMYPIIKTNISSTKKWHYCIKIALVTAIWGLTTELIQKFFVPSRSFDLTDLLADCLGGLTALLICKWKWQYFNLTS
jgi:VanZ family protein